MRSFATTSTELTNRAGTVRRWAHAGGMRRKTLLVPPYTVIRSIVLAFVIGAAVPMAGGDEPVPPVPKGLAREGIVRTPIRPLPFPSEARRWIRLSAGRFDILSSAPEVTTRAIASDLQTLASALTVAGSRFERSTAPTTVLVFQHRSDSQAWFDFLFAQERTPIAGAYIDHEGGGTMFIDGSHHARIERTALHELTHDLLRQSELAIPLWVEEGLAEYFSNATIRNGRILAGDPVREHVLQLQRSAPLTAAQLFEVTQDTPAAKHPSFYAQSWAAVDWLMSLGYAKFYPFLADLGRGIATGDALKQHYGKSSADFDTAIRWRDRLTVRVTLEGSAETAATAVPIDHATLLFELGRFLTHVPGAEQEARRHFRAAVQSNPKHARALAALGEFEAALQAGPDDSAILLEYAESLLKTSLGSSAGVFAAAEGDLERFRKARVLGERALANGGDPGLAHGIIGTSHLVEDDLTTGITHLEKAHAALPRRMDFALNLYWMYLCRDDRQRADSLFETQFERSADRQAALAARNIRLAITTDRANKMVRRGELEEAAALVRELAAATPDPEGRASLAAEAARLDAIALVNRHIQTYNRASALANEGRPREAARLLDELLAVATDAEVIRDAQRLRRRLPSR